MSFAPGCFDAEGQAIAIDYMNDFIIKTLGL